MTEAEIVYRISALYKQVYAWNHTSTVLKNYEVEVNRLSVKLVKVSGKRYPEYTKKEIEELELEHILLGN
ncbi:hypothetical protein UFOVP53_181 [uncultured Caudovirales phage]|uniref:Uncharacterized protein n=1 Tax=uncultured Caudovirales phage TaxID=2100421 RepID=A0A6J5KUF7_9CAUD|nr:hypothetical protein UFOVP53_181 [uncultured Caudovirales phage]